MTLDTLAAKQELEEKGYTCIVRKGEDLCFSMEHGVKPLQQIRSSEKRQLFCTSALESAIFMVR